MDLHDSSKLADLLAEITSVETIEIEKLRSQISRARDQVADAADRLDQAQADLDALLVQFDAGVENLFEIAGKENW